MYDTYPEWIEPEYDMPALCRECGYETNPCRCGQDLAEMDNEEYDRVVTELNEDYYKEFPEFYGYDDGEPIEFGYNEEW
jgi:hypothetical protein